MAFITADQTRNIKKRLKSAFPEYKFSVRNDNHIAVNVTLLSGPRDFSDVSVTSEFRTSFDPTNFGVNQFHLHNYEGHEEFFEAVFAIINDGNFDNSDIMTDYFHVGWYSSLHVGSYDRPFVSTLEEIAV